MIASFRFQVRHHDGRQEDLIVDAGRALVGSGAQCEVRLAQEDAETEHLAVYVRKGAVYAEKRASRGGVTLNGAPFKRGEPDLEHPFVIGRVQLWVTPVERADAVVRKSSPVRAYTIALILFGALYYALFKVKPVESAVRTPANLPDLWSKTLLVCPQRAPEPAARLAGDLSALADSKRERAPFFPQAGVAAVSLYREAAACLTVAANHDAALRLTRDADALGRELVDEFRLSRLRLERAIASQDWETTKKQVQRLKSFLEGQGGEYVTWLNEVERRSAIKLTAATKKGDK